jgi:predicted nucleic acid-binding protein
MIIVLDTGIIGIVTNPNSSTQSFACTSWLKRKLIDQIAVFVPEICDYELRRELLRANKVQGLARLNALNRSLNFLPISSEAMLKAADFWATARKQGQPTAPNAALDADVILAAQAFVIGEQFAEVPIIATTNVKHLNRFVDAREWENI